MKNIDEQKSKQEKTERILVNSSDVMIGKYLTWIIRNQEELKLNNGEVSVLQIIAEQTLSWRLKHAYISIEHFEKNGTSKRTLQRKRTSLTEKKLIKWRKTNGFTMYELILPRDITDDYEFVYLRDPVKASISYITKRLEIDGIGLTRENINVIRKYKKDKKIREKCKFPEQAIDIILEPLIEKKKKHDEIMENGLL
jgi:transposase